MKTSLFHFSADSFLSFHKSVHRRIHLLWRRDLKDIELSTTNHHPTMRQFLSSQKVPKDVVKVLIHPWVKVIPSGTFSKCDRLQEVQFGFAKSKGDSSITTRHDSSSRQEDDWIVL
jgi:hypothetical protein